MEFSDSMPVPQESEKDGLPPAGAGAADEQLPQYGIASFSEEQRDLVRQILRNPPRDISMAHRTLLARAFDRDAKLSRPLVRKLFNDLGVNASSGHPDRITDILAPRRGGVPPDLAVTLLDRHLPAGRPRTVAQVLETLRIERILVRQRYLAEVCARVGTVPDALDADTTERLAAALVGEEPSLKIAENHAREIGVELTYLQAQEVLVANFRRRKDKQTVALTTEMLERLAQELAGDLPKYRTVGDAAARLGMKLGTQAIRLAARELRTRYPVKSLPISGTTHDFLQLMARRMPGVDPMVIMDRALMLAARTMVDSGVARLDPSLGNPMSRSMLRTRFAMLDTAPAPTLPARKKDVRAGKGSEGDVDT